MTGLCCSKRSQSSSDQDQGLSIYLSQSGGAVAVRGRSAMHSQNSVPVHSGSTLSAARPPAAVSQSLRPHLTPPPPPPTRPPAFWEPDHSFGFRETPGIKTALWSPPVCVRAPVYAAPVPIPARDDQPNEMDRNTYFKVPPFLLRRRAKLSIAYLIFMDLILLNNYETISLPGCRQRAQLREMAPHRGSDR